MKLGLSVSDYELFRTLVLEPLKKMSVQVFVFGSRSKGTHHQFSDLDLLLVIQGSAFERSELAKIKETIEESRFPIKIDFVIDSELADSYRLQVDQEKIEL